MVVSERKVVAARTQAFTRNGMAFCWRSTSAQSAKIRAACRFSDVAGGGPALRSLPASAAVGGLASIAPTHADTAQHAVNAPNLARHKATGSRCPDCGSIRTCT